QLRECVMEAMENFEPAERSVVILRDIEGIDYDEISRILKIPLGSVKSKLSRAREKLKQKLVRKMGEKNEL
ncbi:MAG TPA: sigma factor-like helix-turn-helix DNA-binding protein, partial [Candidatus Goldiibacteriota bacterium]|nr:sigma factor-like helix-turn-helix DNA-binding protein [Candidatus Goldiibacteriota bacterium]